MNIRRAVFPVAGFGTRFLPATKAMPKELLPITETLGHPLQETSPLMCQPPAQAVPRSLRGPAHRRQPMWASSKGNPVGHGKNRVN